MVICSGNSWLYSRNIVGLEMRERINSNLVTHRKPASGIVHHSDKGSQYTREDFQKLLKGHYCKYEQC